MSDGTITIFKPGTQRPEVLQVLNVTMPPPTVAECTEAIEAHIDEVARSRGYSGAVALASYTSSTVPAWASEAAAFVAWRDQVWIGALMLLSAVEAGQAPAPATVAEIIGGLPAIVWPA